MVATVNQRDRRHRHRAVMTFVQPAANGAGTRLRDRARGRLSRVSWRLSRRFFCAKVITNEWFMGFQRCNLNPVRRRGPRPTGHGWRSPLVFLFGYYAILAGVLSDRSGIPLGVGSEGSGNSRTRSAPCLALTLRTTSRSAGRNIPSPRACRANEPRLFPRPGGASGFPRQRAEQEEAAPQNRKLPRHCGIKSPL